jgi:hypothetical protein
LGPGSNSSVKNTITGTDSDFASGFLSLISTNGQIWWNGH